MIFMGIPIRGANSKGIQSSPICPCNNEVFVLKVKLVFELPYVSTFYPFACMGPQFLDFPATRCLDLMFPCKP
jgi:hypothetical protein